MNTNFFQHNKKRLTSQPTRQAIAVVGPTASGKSQLGLELAQAYHGYVLSCDSRQIFRGASIGTNQIQGKRVERNDQPAVIVQQIPHYFIGFLKPTEPYSVATFQVQALDLISEEKRLPILVGGTGFYLSALIDGWNFSSGQPDPTLRQQLAQRSLEELSAQLSDLDLGAQKIVASKNRRRIERAIEATLTEGIPFSEQKKRQPAQCDVLQIGLQLPFREIEQRIYKRVDEMMKAGLLDEVQRLQQTYGNAVLDRLGIGYRELGDALLNKISIEEAVRLIKLHTRQYAKRQLTWFKRDHRIRWVHSKPEAFAEVDAFLKSTSAHRS